MEHRKGEEKRKIEKSTRENEKDIRKEGRLRERKVKRKIYNK